MNAMTKTIKVRRANNYTAGVGKHITLTTVYNSPDKMFGFAITDDGDEVYVPAQLVRVEQMTEADVGAGLTCPLKTNPRANDAVNNPLWVATNPIKWDGEAELIEVEDQDDEEDTVSKDDWDAMIKAVEKVGDDTVGLNDLIEHQRKMVSGQQHILTQMIAVRDSVTQMGRTLDDVAPEVNE